MYTVITKWTPNSDGARYLSFAAVKHIIANDNIENGLPLVPPEKYNAEIYGAWAVAVVQYSNYFLETGGNIDYRFFYNDQGSVITAQIFDLEEIHTAVLSQSFYNDFVSARQAFTSLVDVTVEIKKTSGEIGTIDSFDTAELLFDNL